MTVTDAIAATSPNLWWKLDEGSGTTANNSGSLANDGTVSGAVSWETTGPDFGTTAIRLYNTGAIVSAAMDLTSMANVSLGMWVSTPADGLINTQYPIASIGDVSNRNARGLVLYEQHGTIGSPQIHGRWNPGSASGNNLPATATFWHWVVLTITTGTGGNKLWIDGTVQIGGTSSTPLNALLSDPLLLASSQSVVLAHVTFWNRLLTEVEIDSISNARAVWPHELPVNTQGTGAGGGGGVSPETEAQIDEIDEKTDNLETKTDTILSELTALPNIAEAIVHLQSDIDSLQGQMTEALGHLNTLLAVTGEQTVPLLNDLTDYVRRAFMNQVGAILHTPIGNVIAHPDPNLLSAADTSFDISGKGTLPSPGLPGYANVYGLRWVLKTRPTRVGYRDGIIDETTQRLLQLVLYWPDQGTVVLNPQEIKDFHFETYTYYWDRYWPSAIDYDVLPGFVLTCRYMIWQPIIP